MAAAGDVEKARDAVAGVEAERYFGQSETRAVGGDAEAWATASMRPPRRRLHAFLVQPVSVLTIPTPDA